MYIVRKCLIKADSCLALNSAKSAGNKREAKRGRMDRGDKRRGGREEGEGGKWRQEQKGPGEKQGLSFITLETAAFLR